MTIEPSKGPRVRVADYHVGQKIRAQRRALGLSQAELGTRVGVTFQQIQKYERGTNRVSASRLHDIAGVFGLSATVFFDGLPQGPEAQLDVPPLVRRRAAYATSAEGARLIDAFLALPDGMRASILQMIRSLPAGDDA